MNPLVSINLVVYNEEKRIRDCLKAVFNQTYKNYEVLVFDNNSSDKTLEIVRNDFPRAKFFKADKNYSFGPGQNRAAKMTSGKYILGLCADVWIKEDFLEKAVEIMEQNPKIGALQAKIYQLAPFATQNNTEQTQNNAELKIKTNIIDTAGFEIYKSRRIVNRGHGIKDTGQFSKEEEIFSYEGACPFWRRGALEDSAVWGEYHDEDYFWYGDDIDLGWRMHLLGWKNYFTPQVIAWHERQTTKRTSKSRWDFIGQRKSLPKNKKMLDWVNLRLTFIKNDLGIFRWPDIYKFLNREIQLFVYSLIFEPYTIFVGLPRFIRYLPRALKKRKEIMRRKKVSTKEIKRWYK
ncbi:MAG: Glycosyl transferase family protein [Parcubacteria group bacterium GW2011_GWD1_38_16]|nr:MAG: Glycosyl transferase family protein [Parcubacteria group bacterium GW2011_GWC2_36_17]KKQ59474.1 MAG: Glycosyl transferase family protein [Parcubacteria group bacterium GW2011_GWD1_38_16]HAN62115.1 hypothetical protein [Candidatus Azambacteria bacterium]